MANSKLTSNGMINFPAKLRKKLGLVPGDEISFIETEQGILIIPSKSILSAPNPNNYEIAVKMAKEIRKERDEEIW